MNKKLTPAYLDKKLTLGADPEFLLMKGDGGAAYGNDIIGQASYAKFGTDGAGTALEIRPSPSPDPRKVVKSIQAAMAYGLKRHPRTAEYKWKAGGDKAHPIGGHIHFGTAMLDFENDDDYLNMERSLSKSLDCFLSVPLLAIENREVAVYRRSTSGYGRLGDIREQDHGCEYRTPGSWITSPQVSLAVLSLAKVIAVETLSGKLKDPMTVPHGDFTNARIKPAFSAKVWGRIEKMALYPKYKKAIKIIRDLTAAGKTWEAGDLKMSWSLLSPKEIAKLKKGTPDGVPLTKLSKIMRGHRGRLFTVRVAR